MLFPYESHRTRHGPRLRVARRRSVVALTSGRLAGGGLLRGAAGVGPALVFLEQIIVVNVIPGYPYISVPLSI